jgi:opacity protein-like surface antigen
MKASALHVSLCAVVVGLFVLSASAVAQAQETLRRTPRMEAGGGFDYAQPVGDFRQNVTRGFGGAGHFMFGLDPDATIGIRIDAGFVNYGNDTHYVPFSSSVRRIIVQEKTSNNIFIASVGPQITLPIGAARPYINAGIGLAYFYTQTSLSTDDDSYQIAQTTNYSDNSLLYTAGAGFNVPLSFAGDNVGLDVGARYNSIDNARYLTKGDIVDDPNSQYGIIITPHQSAANFIAYHLGVNVRF